MLKNTSKEKKPELSLVRKAIEAPETDTARDIGESKTSEDFQYTSDILTTEGGEWKFFHGGKFVEIQMDTGELKQNFTKNTSENLTIGVHNSPMESNIKSTDTQNLRWTIIGTGVAILSVILPILFYMDASLKDRMDISIKATEAIRDQTVAKTDSILTEIKSSNEKVLFELQGTRKEMNAFSKDIDNKLTIFKLEIENEQLNNKLEERKRR